MTPLNHYQLHDCLVSTLTEASQKIEEINQYAASRNLRVFWRGQMDHRWGLNSSLVRQVSNIAVPDDTMINKIEDRILEEASSWINDFQHPLYNQPLAKLAYLQHHGIPTRLLDFTRDLWMAMFFAAEAMDEVDGRLFALLVNDDSLLAGIPAGAPWRRYTTSQIKVWDPVAVGVTFPRLAAQQGVLIVGRLPSTNPHRKGYDDVLKTERSLLAEEVRKIFSVPFKLCQANPIPPNAAPSFGLTMRLHVNKESIRRDLERRAAGRRICPLDGKIHHPIVYPDADGMRLHSKFLVGLSKSVVLPT